MSNDPPEDIRQRPQAIEPEFGGLVGRSLSESRPWWPRRHSPPRNAPNVVIVVADDLGFSDLGCYGSEIDTPNIDTLAATGLRYVNFHSTPMCAPSRAALLTGLNPHQAGVGAVALDDSGFPGYRCRLPDDVLTAADIFRANGYATLMVGKWHLNPREDISEAADRGAWPLQRGFDRFYGFTEPIGFTNFHHPHRLIEDNHAVQVDQYPPGYYLTDDLTDQALAMIRSIKASEPDKPFFMHLAHAAVHGPLMAKAADIEKYRGRYDTGWDAIRAERFSRQHSLRVIQSDTRLAPRNSEPGYEVTAWNELPGTEQKLFARHMEVYAAMIDSIDQNLGRLRLCLEQLGEWDNTVLIFTSDNGASGDGGARGTTNYVCGQQARLASDAASMHRDYAIMDQLGGPRVLGHYPRGWAMASNTPFRLQKMTAFAGAHQVPFLLSWPAKLPGWGGIRSQYTHLIDVLPTLVDLIGLDVPKKRNGISARAMTGTSIAPSIADPAAPSARPEQYYEIWGHRGYYREGWEAVTLHAPGADFDRDDWQLYHLAEDPTEIDNLAGSAPGKVKALAESWEQAAWENNVFPLRDNVIHAMTGPQAGRTSRTITLYPGTPTLEPHQSRSLVQGRSVLISVLLDFQERDQGILISHGDQGGGYTLYIEDGELFFFHHMLGQATTLSGGVLDAGPTQIEIALKAQAGGMWDATLTANASERSSGTLRIFSRFCPFEGIDIGIGRRSPVSWDIYERHGPFPYTGKLHSVTYTPQDFAPDAPEQRALEARERMMRAD